MKNIVHINQAGANPFEGMIYHVGSKSTTYKYFIILYILLILNSWK